MTNMENLNDIIFNRDLRTTRSVYNIEKKSIRSTNESETCENCDKIGKCRRKKYFIKSRKHKSSKFPTKLFNILIVVTSIFILSSTSQIEAHPVQKRQTQRKMTEASMKTRLENILTGCKIAIGDSEYAIDTYYEVVWNSDKKNHSKTWEDTKMASITSWLYPKQGQLKKKYNGVMHQDHKEDLLNTTWNLRMVFEYLEDIYERLGRIRLGFEVISKWLSEMRLNGALRQDEFESMTSLFKNASVNIGEVIIQIHLFFEEAAMNSDYEMKAIDAEPLKVDEVDSKGKENIKLQHWFVYREYEHVMEYAKELIEIITNKTTKN